MEATNNYKDIIQGAFEKLIIQSELISQNEWQENVKKENFVSHFKFDDNLGLVNVRGEGVINAPIKKVIEVIYNPEKRMIYDPQVSEVKLIEKIDETTQITYTRMKGKLMVISDRDFVVLSSLIEKDGKTYMVNKSIQHQKQPEVNGAVRGEIHQSGWILSPIDENKTKAIHVVCSDPKGNIPGFIRDNVAKKRPELILWINEAFEKSKL